MGEIYEAKCSCGYNTTLQLGAGLGAYNLNLINNLLENADSNQFMDALQQGNIKKYELTNSAYYCKDCQSIGSVFLFTYQLNSGEVIHISGKCAHCNKEVLLLEQDKMPCPVCCNKLKLEEVGNWE